MSAIASSSRCIRPVARMTYAYAGVRHSSTQTSSPTPPPAPSPRRRRRAETAPRGNVDLIAPPDPMSNIRPIIYASASTSTRPTSKSSPYSTGEFPYSERDAALQDLELEWRFKRERVDMMNHRFWSATNSEFNAQLQNRLSQLPTPSDPPSTEDIRRKEETLSQFYADWVITNRDQQVKWVKEWWQELWDGLKMQSRVHVAKLLKR